MRIGERIREFFIGALLENVPLKLLSLSFALSLWAWVQSEQVVTRRVRARIKYAWPSIEELVRVGEYPTRLVVTLEGPQGMVRSIDPDQLWVEIDLTAGLEGDNLVDFTTAQLNGLSDSSPLTISQISPPEADIMLENPSDRLVRVDPITVGELADGFQLVSVTVEPEMVRIIGPQSQVLETSLIPTDIIDIAELSEDRVVEVPLQPGGNMRVDLTPPRVKVTIDTEAILITRTFTEVPVMIRGEGWESDISAVRVVLQGPVADVRAIDSTRVSIVAHLPDPPPGVTPFPIHHMPDNPGAGIEVLHGGSEEIVVIELAPGIINLSAETPPE
ncbi:MAG: YbbR domain-containing protein [Myxococcota bacterium]|jgi:YbbR domain-containing protein